MHSTRRQFLRATVTGIATVGLAGRVAANHSGQRPDHVEIVYDAELLSRYQPRLDLTAVENNSKDTLPNGMFGWIARSPEHDVDCAVYYTEYPYQRGILLTGHDSHFGDHEPVYVYYNSTTGEVEEVVYSAYHWLRGRTRTPTLQDETHPVLSVISPWHQYSLGGVNTDTVELKSLGDGQVLDDPNRTTEFEAWLDNGIEEHLQPGTVTNPWIMHGAQGRDHWWRDSVGGVSKDAIIVSAALKASKAPFIDIKGASESDLL
jgi:hypothetical protein